MLGQNSTEFQAAVAELQQEGKLPSALAPRQVALLQESFNRYAGEVGQRMLEDILAEFQAGINEALSGQTSAGQPRDELLYHLTANVGEEIADQLRFGMGVAQSVVKGAFLFMNQNLTPEAIQAYPALALERFYRRQVPRGWKRLGKTIIPVPADDWPARWGEARAKTGGVGSLPWSGDSQGGRGVALKSSPIWHALGTLREDSLGNGFAPFAFNSGFDTSSVSRKETEALGLLEPGQRAEGANVNLENLFAKI